VNDFVKPPLCQENKAMEYRAESTRMTAAFVWIDRSPRAYNETIVSLLGMDGVAAIYVGFARHVNSVSLPITDSRIHVIKDASLLKAAKIVFAGKWRQVLCISFPIKASSNTLELANKWMDADPRIATLSFLSNAGGYLSFPYRNTQTPFCVEGHDEDTLTRRLRADKPKHWGPVPLPVAEGAMIAVNSSLVEVCGDLNDGGTENLAFAIAELSLRVTRRGFNNYLDPYTFITVPFDGVGAFPSVLENPDARHALHQIHPQFPAIHDTEKTRENSILGQALDYARAKAQGLRVLLDGSALGPKEMGTQSLVVNLAKTLAQRDDIQWVALGVPDVQNIPSYARDLLNSRKIRFVPSGSSDFPEGPVADVIHRPYQPSSPLPWERWSLLAKRSVITVQDLIAYRNPSYFAEWSDWDDYRENFKRQIANCDGVFSISHDVVNVIREERLPIDGQRVFVVENGADARSKDQPTNIPSEVIRRGWTTSSYLMVLGATYAHKNRDLAIKVWKRLRQRGFKHKLILAGASVPYGSTRFEEALEVDAETREDMLVLPDIGSEERNWLLLNSSLVMYLTSAEGFGLVPFEAARMDVPTLFVSFGPLRELIDDPNLPTNYDLQGLTERAALLLTDDSAAMHAIKSALQNLETLNWEETARKSVEAYFELMNQPSKLPKN